jgi:hypothetical protein
VRRGSGAHGQHGNAKPSSLTSAFFIACTNPIQLVETLFPEPPITHRPVANRCDADLAESNIIR